MKRMFKYEDLMGCSLEELRNLIRPRAKLTLKGNYKDIELTGKEKVEPAHSRFINNGKVTDGLSPKGIRLIDEHLIYIPQIESLTIEE